MADLTECDLGGLPLTVITHGQAPPGRYRDECGRWWWLRSGDPRPFLCRAGRLITRVPAVTCAP